jgi:hypothetical protein
VSFRADLLDGRRIALTGVGAGTGIDEQLRSHGAELHVLDPERLGDEDTAAAWARERAPLTALVVHALPGFGTGGGEALTATLELAWRAARAVATGALIEQEPAGRLLFVTPRPDAGPLAAAARAGLENLARTLSVEWARFAITAVAIAPGTATSEAEVAELVSFLVSPAGGYYSGCRFDLGAVAVRAS